MNARKQVRGSTSSNITWVFLERITNQLIGLIVTIVMARLISPQDYGTITIVSTLLNLFIVFVTEGLPSALIQKSNTDSLDFTTVLFANFLLSLTIYMVIFFSAPLVVLVYDGISLVSLIRVMALQVVIGSINSVQRAELAKNMRFRPFFFSSLVGKTVSGIVAITLAMSQYGIWAIAIHYLVSSISDTFILCFIKRPNLSGGFDVSRLNALAKFGWKVTVTQFLIVAFGNIRNLLIGYKFSASDLAYASRGEQIPSIVSQSISMSFSQVLFSVLSKDQEKVDTVKASVRLSMQLSTFVLAPLMFGTFALSDLIIMVLFSDKWAQAIPFLRIFSLIYLLQPIQMISIQTMKALGRSDIYLRLEILKKAFNLAILLYTVFFIKKVEAIILGSLISEIISSLLNVPIIRKLINYSYKEQLQDVFASTMMAAIMLVLISWLNSIHLNKAVLLLLLSVIGAILYLLMSVITMNKSMLYLYEKFRKFRNKSKYGVSVI